MIRNPALFLGAIFLFAACDTSTTPVVQAPVEGHSIISDSGMVVSAHPESSRIGIMILKKGGNAVDAAVAVEFALAVCYPEAGNIGGGGFMLVREADGRTDLIDYREKAPQNSFANMYLDAEGNVRDGLSTDSHMASGVPGTVDGMLNIHSKYGILSFRDVIQPAIDLALKGFPVTSGQAADLNDNRERFLKMNDTKVAFVRDAPWKGGDTLRQPDLARTLELIRDHGRDGFYSGRTARLIVSEMERGNGIMTLNDLSEYNSVFRDPVSAWYRGYRVISASPPSGGGIILLQILGMIEPYDLKQLGFHTVSSVHLIAEAEKRAFADRAEYLGDPDFVGIPLKEMLDTAYLHSRMINFNTGSATPSSSLSHGSFATAESEETTHYTVVDCHGNAVAATTTLNNTFGSAIVVDSAGFLLNNQMDDFSVKPGFPNMYGLIGSEANSIKGGKRMLSSMTPVIVEKDGSLFLAGGSPGGSTIPTTVLQVLINVIDYGMNIRQAVDTGRFHHQWLPDLITYENNSLDQTVIAGLGKIGHHLKSRASIGRVNAVMILPGNRKWGVGDTRGDNSAMGY
ncbi:MAG TPA: gamma-glutamyltransferase [Bacteroidales bacterium]|jgi:gamma-glutamyltranspeptidase/glutathione hydrolase|nr:gamma-glutamyltransferase [Bacteroidales bacterium]